MKDLFLFECSVDAGDEKKNKPKEKKPFVYPFYIKPRNEQERLFNAQYDYRVKNDKKALEAVYTNVLAIAQKLITKLKRKNGKVATYSPFDLEAKAIDTASFFVEKYLTDSDFAVKKNFLSLIYSHLLHEFFYHTSLKVEYEENEYFDTAEALNSDEDENTDNEVMLYDEIFSICDSLSQSLQSFKESLKERKSEAARGYCDLDSLLKAVLPIQYDVMSLKGRIKALS